MMVRNTNTPSSRNLKWACLAACMLARSAAVCGFGSLDWHGEKCFADEPVERTTKSTDFTGPVKIAKLLWNANAAGAASTLRRSILTAVERKELPQLRAELEHLTDFAKSVAEARNDQDARYSVALAVGLITDPNASLNRTKVVLANGSNESVELLWRVWLSTQRAKALEFLSRAIRSKADTTTEKSEVPRDCLQVMVREALAVGGSEAAEIVLDHWMHLDQASQLTAIEPLAAKADSMEKLIDAIARGAISKDLVNPNQLRKWVSNGSAELASKIEKLYGKILEGENAERQLLVTKTLAALNAKTASGSASHGTLVFDRVCSQCHILHGRGYEVGPNIAGNGRGNLPQLVSNVLDPSLVIGEAFQARTIMTVDGEIISGLVVGEDEQYLKIKLQGAKVLELAREDIEQSKTSSKSLMPEGIEAQMTKQEMFDLFAYLCLLKPLGEPDNELIPGTPANFVQP